MSYPGVNSDARSTYDGMSRLRVRSEYTWMVGTGWYQGPVTRYIYDGMRVVQERSGGTTPSVAYTRGKDLSGTLEGAGGIGGLLARSHGYSAGNWSTHNFYHADALGNATYMVSGAQAMVASYKYDPYGRTISSSGTLASANLYRFSSKEVSAVSGMYYYGYRFYDPKLQRWVNRDPLGEEGGLNLYRFVNNSPNIHTDSFGLIPEWMRACGTRAAWAGLGGAVGGVGLFVGYRERWLIDYWSEMVRYNAEPGDCIYIRTPAARLLGTAGFIDLAGTGGYVAMEICKDCNGKVTRPRYVLFIPCDMT